MSSRGGTPAQAAWHAHADDDGYSERDLGDYARAAAPYYAPASAPHGRYSLPPLHAEHAGYYAAPAPQRATSLEVGSVYGSEPCAAPASQYSRSSAGHAPWGAGAPMHAAPSPPPWQSPEQAYWYAGAPPSVASRSSGAYARALPLSPPPMGEYDAEEGGPGFFGVEAAHHLPGRRGGGGQRDEYARPTDELPAFPPWSRSWYAGHLSADGHAYTTVPPPGSGWESETMTRSGASRAHAPYGHPYGRPPGAGEAEYVKEERMRMLEKEFGAPRISHGGRGDDEELDEGEEDELVLGSVDAKGRLITERPRVVLWLRIFLGLAAVAALACGLGGALLIKTVGPPPAAKGTIAAYVLYIASALTVVVLLYVYVLRPCCCDPRRKVAAGDASAGLGGLVIPVLSGGAGGKAGKPPKGFKGMKGMKGMKGGMGAGPTVNLVIDPTLLGRGRGDSDSEDEEEHLPGGARRKRRKRRSPLGMLGNMQLQARWRVARATVKLQTTWDAVLLVLWIGAVVVALGMGKKCPAGSSGGWCDFYNAAIACGVLVAATLVVLLYFDYRDLRISRTPPKAPL